MGGPPLCSSSEERQPATTTMSEKEHCCFGLCSAKKVFRQIQVNFSLFLLPNRWSDAITSQCAQLVIFFFSPSSSSSCWPFFSSSVTLVCQCRHDKYVSTWPFIVLHGMCVWLGCVCDGILIWCVKWFIIVCDWDRSFFFVIALAASRIRNGDIKQRMKVNQKPHIPHASTAIVFNSYDRHLPKHDKWNGIAVEYGTISVCVRECLCAEDVLLIIAHGMPHVEPSNQCSRIHLVNTTVCGYSKWLPLLFN